MKVFVAFNLIILCGAVFGDFPNDVTKCQFGDTNCVAQQITNVLATRSGGDRSLNIVPLDPLKINSIDISQGAESPVNIDLKFRNSDFHGLASSAVTKTKGFGADLKGPHEIHAKVPIISLIGDYTINGRILLLPITGNGKSNMTITNADIALKFDGVPNVKNGKTHLKVNNINLDMKINGALHMALTNLFNGDKTLGDNMNVFLNENWRDIWGEIKVSVLKAFQLIFKSLINNTFDKYPYDELFV